MHEVVWVDQLLPCAVFGGVGRITASALPAPGEPLRPIRFPAAARQEIGREFSDEFPGIPLNRQIRSEEFLLQLGRIDIHRNLNRRPAGALPVVTYLTDVVARTDREDQVGVLQNEIPGPLALRADPSGVERVVGRKDSDAVEGRKQRNLKLFGELEKRFFRSGDPDAGSGDDRRAFRLPEQGGYRHVDLGSHHLQGPFFLE